MKLILEFDSISELVSFIAAFSRNNEDLLKQEVNKLDKSSNALQTAMDAQKEKK